MTDPGALARFMFDRQALSYGADPGERDRIWAENAGVRSFWLAEAEAVIGFLGLLF